LDSEIKSELLLRFPRCLTAKENAHGGGFDLRLALNMKDLIHRLQDMSGIRFSDRLLNVSEKDPLSQENDIIKLTAR